MGSLPAPSPGAGDEPNPFRFLNFPAEIRNHVYAELLCPYPNYQLNAAGHNHWPHIAPLFHTSILLTSRQVHREARHVMLRGNQFIRVFTRGVPMSAMLARLPVHVVVHTHCSKANPIVREFKGAVMSYTLKDELHIREHGSAPCNTCDMLILGRDLDALVRGLADPATGTARLATETQHRINIHDPFKKSKDPNYSNLAMQKDLLQPFRDHFHGFTRVKIQGRVDPAFAAAVRVEVRHEPLPDPDELIPAIRLLKDEGNALFRAGDFFGSSERWRAASSKLQRVRTSANWPRTKAKFGPELVDEMAELFFTLHSNAAQAVLAEMREYDPDLEMDQVQLALDRVEHSSHMADTASEAFEAAWVPSDRQTAKLCFRSAQACRLAGDLMRAQAFIDHAMEMQPDDGQIQREADEIMRYGILMMNDLGMISLPGIGI